MPLISVIVPVYRTEKFLNRCVDSILAQTYQELEILLIDDGSPDRCAEICDAYAQKDPRIKVLHKTNAGVSAARNSGLDLATGDYITFVDSDDYVEPDMYRAMMDVARQYNCDVVMCDCMKDYQGRSELYTHNIRPGFYSKEQLKQEYYPHLLMMENMEYPATITNCLCLIRRRQSQRRSVNQAKSSNDTQMEHKDSCPRYVEGVRFSEDLLFGAQLMYMADSFYYMKGQAYYHYCCTNLQSITHTFAPDDKWKSFLKLYDAAENFFLNRPDYDFTDQLDRLLLFLVYHAVGSILATRQLAEKEKLAQAKRILNDSKVRAMFKRLPVRKLPVPKKLKLLTWCYRYKIGLRLMLRKARKG